MFGNRKWRDQVDNRLDDHERRLNDHEQQLAEQRARMDAFCDDTERRLDNYGDYSNRTDGELRVIRQDLDQTLASLEHLIQYNESKHDVTRAKNLKRRLKNHRTRAQRANYG